MPEQIPAAENAAPAPAPAAQPAPTPRPARQPSPQERIAALMGEPETAPAPARTQDGKFTAAPPVAKPVAPEQPQDEEAAAPETQRGEERTEGGEPEGQDDAISISTLSELAEHIGVDVADLYNLRVPVTTAEGVKSEISLGEWKDGYQQSTKLSKAQQEIQEARRALEMERAQVQERIARETQEAGTLLHAIEEQWNAEFQGIDWNNLKASDPAEWAVRRQEMTERQARIREMRQQAAQRLQAMQREQQSQQAKALSEQLKREHEALNAAIPEWRDAEKAKAEKQALRDYLSSSGFTADELEAAYDHRALVLARKAMLYDQQQRKADAARKKVTVKIGGKQVLQPGTRAPKAEAVVDKVNALRAQLRKSGKVDDAAALLEARMTKR